MMKKAPNMISTKDLSYLADIFGWNFTAAKKAYSFAEEAEDKQVREEFNKTAQMHESICKKILGLLK